MSRLPQGVGLSQIALTKNNKKNSNSINIMNTLNERSKLSNEIIHHRLGKISNDAKQKISKPHKEQQMSIVKEGKAGFFNNAKFKPHKITNLPQSRMQTPALNRLQTETVENMMKQKNRFSLQKAIRINKALKNLDVSATSNNKLSASNKKSQKSSLQKCSQKHHSQIKKILPSLSNKNFSLATNCIFPKSKRILTTEEQVLSKRNIPGPGNYNLFIVQTTTSAIRFGTGSRLLDKVNSNPGPGLYTFQHSQLSRKGGVISRQKRYASNQDKSPGPAKYEMVSLNKTRQNTTSVIINCCERDKKQQKLKKWPGPGQYSVNQTLSNSRVLGGTIGKSRRDTQKVQTSPGPNIYSPKYQQVFKKSPTFVIGSEIRQTCETNLFRTNTCSSNKLRKTVISGKNISVNHSQAAQDSPNIGSNLKSKSQMKKNIESK